MVDVDELKNSLHNLGVTINRLHAEKYVVAIEVNQYTADLVQLAIEEIAAKMNELELEISFQEIGDVDLD